MQNISCNWKISLWNCGQALSILITAKANRMALVSRFDSLMTVLLCPNVVDLWPSWAVLIFPRNEADATQWRKHSTTKEWSHCLHASSQCLKTKFPHPIKQCYVLIVAGQACVRIPLLKEMVCALEKFWGSGCQWAKSFPLDETFTTETFFFPLSII